MKLYVRIVQALFLMVLTILLVVPAQRVVAQGTQNERQRQLEAAGGARGAGLTATDPRWVVTNIITVALSVIGVIIFCFMFYAGFIWLTAAGDDEKVNHAKEIIQTTVVGLLIALIAYSLTVFVLTQVLWAADASPDYFEVWFFLD